MRANLDEGEPFGLPGTYLNSLLRAAAAAARGGRLRLPGVRSDARQRHRRQDHPPARRRRAVRPPLRRAPQRTSGSSTSAPASCAASSNGCRPPATACACARRGSSPSPSAPRPRSSTRSSRSTGRCASSSSRSSSPTSRCRSAPGTRAQPRVLDSPLQSEEHSSYESRVVLVHSTRLSKLRLAAAMDHLVDGPGEHRDVDRDRARRRPRDDRRRSRRGQSAESREVPRLRRVEPALAAGRQGSRRGRAGRGAAHRLGRACSKRSAPTSTTSGTRADVELDGDTELQQAIRFALFHTLQAGARAEQRAIGAKGLTGPGYDGHTFWDSERFVLPVLTYTAPRAAADALRWRHSTLDLARERAGPARPGRRRLPVAHDPRPRVLGLLARRHGRLPHRRRHRRRGRAVPARGGRPGLRARDRARAARRDGAALALARPPRRAGPLPDRRRDRPGRVQRGRRQQRLHQPDGPAEPERRGRRRRDAIPAVPRRSEPTSRRRRPGGTPPST